MKLLSSFILIINIVINTPVSAVSSGACVTKVPEESCDGTAKQMVSSLSSLPSDVFQNLPSSNADIRVLSRVSTTTNQKLQSTLQDRRKQLHERLWWVFEEAIQYMGLQSDIDQFIDHFPLHHFNNPARFIERGPATGTRIVTFPRRMCRRCRGEYDSCPALVFQLSKTDIAPNGDATNDEEKYLVIKMGRMIPGKILVMTIVSESFPGGDSRVNILPYSSVYEGVLRDMYRRSLTEEDREEFILDFRSGPIGKVL